MNIVEIEVYDKRLAMTGNMYVEQLLDNVFRAVENEIFNCRLTLGTEFETRLNSEGKHEIIRITKESDYMTRRFFLLSQLKESEYRLLADEIIRQGGYWQTDFGGIATINLPRNCELNLDEIFEIFGANLTEIV